MKPLSCEVTNFGPWKKLKFDFNNIGLALVSGATGSGKSTLLDIAPWILYGHTAKGGSVDEVRSWQAGKEPTRGSITVLAGMEQITVCRVRGGPGQNDLFWFESESSLSEIRGKDINDTQKLLEVRLGVSEDVFLTGSYYHEFSDTKTFFVAKAKDRRALFERICDLSFPGRLAGVLSDETRDARGVLKELDKTISGLESSTAIYGQQLPTLRTKAEQWEERVARDLALFAEKSAKFEEEKAKKLQALQEKSKAWEEATSQEALAIVTRITELKALARPTKEFDLAEAKARNEARCTTCGALPKNLAELLEKIVENKFKNNQYLAEMKIRKREFDCLQVDLNPHKGLLESLKLSHNQYQAKAKDLMEQVNPFSEQADEAEESLERAQEEFREAQKLQLALHKRYKALEELHALTFTHRGYLVNQTVQDIQNSTNRYLETYFDAEIRVLFTARDADNLDIAIYKSGYACAYTQLSKGQRQLLNLTFSLSVMKQAANNNGSHFSSLMIDEGLEGLDPALKLKAYRFFEELATQHETVLVVDHDQSFSACFSKKYHVTLCGDNSQLEYEGD